MIDWQLAMDSVSFLSCRSLKMKIVCVGRIQESASFRYDIECKFNFSITWNVFEYMYNVIVEPEMCMCVYEFWCCSGMTRFLPDRQKYFSPPGTSCQPRLASLPDNHKSSESSVFSKPQNLLLKCFVRHLNFVSVIFNLIN